MTADLRKLLGDATKAADNADSRDADSYRLFCSARLDLRDAAINALPDLLDVVDAAQRFTTLNLCAGQSTDDDVALDAAFDALTAALAQWEKRK